MNIAIAYDPKQTYKAFSPDKFDIFLLSLNKLMCLSLRR